MLFMYYVSLCALYVKRVHPPSQEPFSPLRGSISAPTPENNNVMGKEVEVSDVSEYSNI